MKRLVHRSKNIVYLFLLFFTNRIVSYIPCWALRKFWFTRIMGMRIGEKSKIDMGCYFLGLKGISIGKNTHINQGCILDGRNHMASEIMGGGYSDRQFCFNKPSCVPYDWKPRYRLL